VEACKFAGGFNFAVLPSELKDTTVPMIGVLLKLLVNVNELALTVELSSERSEIAEITAEISTPVDPLLGVVLTILGLSSFISLSQPTIIDTAPRIIATKITYSFLNFK